jgi:ABC-2 type transport system ATP-binding protein
MSKGMQQRLGIAQALVGRPRLLLLDEPTSALDPVGRRVVRGLLEELRRRGVSVLLNTHLLSEVERVCDRIAIVNHGRLVREGRPQDLEQGAGVEVETNEGLRRFRDATREDAPRIVAELVAAGAADLRSSGRARHTRGRLLRRGGGRGHLRRRLRCRFQAVPASPVRPSAR